MYRQDSDEADRLCFEEFGYEHIVDIDEFEQSHGVVQLLIITVERKEFTYEPGQLPQNIALCFKQNGVKVSRTDTEGHR